MKVELVHDHLNQQGGAEVVLESLLALYPGAPVHTLIYDEEALGEMFEGQDIRTSFLQSLPFAGRILKWMLPLMPTATELHDLSDADVVISSSSAFAKGILTKPESVHVCYCHTPTRYLWMDSASYIKAQRAPQIVKKLLPPLLTYLRIWDRSAADRVDYFIANSETVAERIRRYYRRESTVIYPPVETRKYTVQDGEKTYYLAGGRLVDYKRIDLVIEAFNELKLPLKVFGDGPEMEKLKELAGPTVELLGRVSEDEKIRLFEGAISYLHPQEEDFGLTAVESMAAGRPVIAFGKGGATETVSDGKTGVFFYEQTVGALVQAVHNQQGIKWNPTTIREHAEQFSTEQFHKNIHAFVKSVWKKNV